jgi:choline dehydrogenase
MKWDVVIVGGGAAGCVLARRLAADGQTAVLLLEAGPDYPDSARLPDEIRSGGTQQAEDPGSVHNWALRGTLTRERGEIHVAQGKVIGGGSSINGQTMQRGFPEDFGSWSALGNDEWSYEKVLPYFRASEHDLDFPDDPCHGSDGPMPVRRRQAEPWPDLQRTFHDACLAEGFGITADKNGLKPAGVGVIPSNNLDGVRMSVAMTYLNPVRHQLNLTVRGQALVRRVVIEGGRATGVEAESGGQAFRVEAGKVVLCAGAIRSPQLLMLSGIGPADHLRQFGIATVADLPGVGQNLWNHLRAETTFALKDGVSLATHEDAPRFYLHYTAEGSAAANDMLMWSTPVGDGGKGRVTGPGGEAPAEQAARISCRLGLPDGGGYVRLTSADAAVQPEFNFCFLQNPNDRRRVRDGVRMAAGLLKTGAYAQVAQRRINPGDDVLASDEALDTWIRRTVSMSRHVSGTCAMGPGSDPRAVVDQYCKVNGVDGLWVADASIMPRIPRSGGAHATVIMIGERVAGWIAVGS